MLTQNSAGRQIIQITLSNSGGGSYSVAIQCSHLKATSPAKFSWAGCLQTVLLLLLWLHTCKDLRQFYQPTLAASMSWFF